MKSQCVERKRIWEVDCWSLDAAIAASFDWRDLVNLLLNRGHTFDTGKMNTFLEIQAQLLIHGYCHSENELSICIETLLNHWHEKTIETFAGLSPSQTAERVLTMPLENAESYGGLFWALGLDSRDHFECIRRRFYQRFQIHSIRRWASLKK